MISQLIDFRDRNYLVTGGARGMGRALAQRLLALDANVWVVSREAPLDLDAQHVSSDLADEGQREHLAEAFSDTKLDGIVFNPGAVGDFCSFSSVKETELRELWEQNFLSPYLLLQTLFRKRCLGSSASVVVNVAHVAAYAPQSTSAYAASLAALHTGLLSASRDLVAQHMRINFVLHGPVDTGASGELVPDAHIMSADEAIGAMLFLLTPAARWMNGSSLRVDGGMSVDMVPSR
ncbi:hypothetical protein C0J09_15780 [Bordetella avium]|uniref:SDR family NAD(P)-dependent oxidoreductase n=1 Tax=Bordetella avium TaxID=521 RepID=UPI000FDA966D|nr:SDR family oxidoreductase [Bordetella avium]AZY50421.1 hypothetical protein C0J09_15780 [Bordetella avium]